MRPSRLWDTDTGALIRTLAGHTGSVNSVTFSPDGNSIATGSGNWWGRTVRLWDAHTGHLIHTLNWHTGGVKSVAFSPDGNKIASDGDDNTFRLWDAPNGDAHTYPHRAYG